MTDTALPESIQSELNVGKDARAAGNEGRARVHARRAAGEAARMYRTVYFASGRHLNAFRHLQHIAVDINLPGDLRAAAARLTERVRPDHTLPHAEDPLDDARMLAAALLSRLPEEG